MTRLNVNLNDHVKIKLTPHGRDILVEKTKMLLADFPEQLQQFNNGLGVFHEKLQGDEDGYTTWQLWEVMHYWGDQMYNGNPKPPLEMEIIIC